MSDFLIGFGATLFALGLGCAIADRRRNRWYNSFKTDKQRYK